MTALPPPELLRFSDAAMTRGSKSFARAAVLLPREARAGALLLYAWCRHCDDVIDGQTLGHDALALPAAEMRRRVEHLRAQTSAALAGEPIDDPAFQALAWVARRHAIPARHPLELIDGFAMDAANRRYATFDDLMPYCYRVAGVVGVMMARIMGVTGAATLRRASDLGLAFQLTNIARDVIDDARAGRVYLPLEWLMNEGLPVEPGALAAPRHRSALHAVAARLVDAAEPYYDSARIGITRLPYRCAWSIATALRVYRAIGLRVAGGGPGVWDKRVHTGKAAKLAHAAAASVDAALAARRGRKPQPPRDPL